MGWPDPDRHRLVHIALREPRDRRRAQAVALVEATRDVAVHVRAGQREAGEASVQRLADIPGFNIDRVAAASVYTGSVVYPNNGFAQALRTVAGTIVRGIGTRVFWVQTGGYDTHAGQGTLTGTYNALMTTLNDGLLAFYDDLGNQGLLNETLILQFSEFGRRIQDGHFGIERLAHGIVRVYQVMRRQKPKDEEFAQSRPRQQT